MTKSKDRIADYGEVFTSEREVEAMLDLVEHETWRIDARFFEPACGDGNFLSPILARKMARVKERYAKSQLDFERNTFLAVSAVYGIDILEDNVGECRKRLYNLVDDMYSNLFKKVNKQEFLYVIQFVLSKNILHGDALTLTNVTTGKPIVFAEWCFVGGSRVVRTDYTLNNLLAYQPFDGASLFSDLGDEAFIPHPHQKFQPRHFLEVQNDF